MNKTLSIGLAGFSFIIEEHAYIKLSDYLAALRRSLDVSEADEVMHDIEIRMVEIFKDSLGKREVINDGDVEKVIAQIGKPEVIEEQEETYFSDQKKSQKSTGNDSGSKQLFRDPERAKLGGVCAGLAQYFGMDITVMRVIWTIIALTGIFTIAISTSLILFLYLILWIVLPKAITASDFLKMKGKPVNFDNLKEESNKIVQFTNEAGQKVGEMYNESKPYLNKAGSGVWNVIRFILGAIFAVMAIGSLIGAFAIFGIAGNNHLDFMGNIGFYLKDSSFGFVPIAFAFLSAFIPALIFTFIAIKLLSPNTKLNYTGYVFGGLVLLWILLLGIIGFTAVKQGTMYTGKKEEVENLAITTNSDSIFIDTKKVEIPENFKSYWDDIYSDGKTIYKEDHPSLDIKRENVAAPYLVIRKEADGYNQPLKTKIPVEIIGNKVILPNYFSYPYEYRFRDYHVNYELVVPKPMQIVKLKKYGIYINDEDLEENYQTQDSVMIKKNGGSVVYRSDFRDSVIINGKKYPEAVAKKILDSLNYDFRNIDKLKINIDDDKKEVIIKTK